MRRFEKERCNVGCQSECSHELDPQYLSYFSVGFFIPPIMSDLESVSISSRASIYVSANDLVLDEEPIIPFKRKLLRVCLSALVGLLIGVIIAQLVANALLQISYSRAFSIVSHLRLLKLTQSLLG